MTRRHRSAGDDARAAIFYWSKRLKASGRQFPTRDQLIAEGGSMEAIVAQMTKENIASLNDEAAHQVIDFDSSLTGSRPGPDWARELLQMFDVDDTFFSTPTTEQPQRQGGRPKADWTEELWFACMRRILDEGMFTSEVELRKFVTNHLAAAEIYPAENTIKAKAREFWRRAALGENPPA